MQKKQIFLVRHGHTGFGKRYIGATDVPLSDKGMAGIRNLQSDFVRQKGAVVMVSPMLRCRQSAELLFPGKTFQFDEGLREIDFGRWEGLDFAEVAVQDPGLVDSWAEGLPSFCFPEGESVAAFTARVHGCGERIWHSSEDTVIVIAHGGVIRALICFFLRIDYEKALLFQVDKGRFVTLDLFSAGAVLTGLNRGGGQ